MANSNEITFFDLPSRHKGEDQLSCFSFNPWRTRLVLNYKNLPYHTHWTEYPDLKPVLSALGLPPNEPGTAFAPYSSPAIIIPSANLKDGKPLMQSFTIATALEEQYPSPPLRLDASPTLEAEKVVRDVTLVIGWDAMVATQDVCLPPRSREYFARTRKEVFGATLEELSDAKGGEVAWMEAEKEGGVLEEMKGLLTKYKRDDGAFVLGSQVSYADFVVVALFECLRRVDPPAWERLKRFHKSFGELHEACEKWLDRDN